MNPIFCRSSRIHHLYLPHKPHSIFIRIINIILMSALIPVHLHRQLRYAPFQLYFLNRIPIIINLERIPRMFPIPRIILIISSNYICHKILSPTKNKLAESALTPIHINSKKMRSKRIYKLLRSR